MVKREELRVDRDSVALELRDTVREVTTITIDRNETGDTLRLTQVTERERSRERDRFRVQDSRLMVVHDTIFVERKDSVLVQGSGFTVKGDQSGKTALQGTLKWIFWIICAIIALVITVKLVWRRGS